MAWNPPAQGTKKRDSMSGSDFLVPSEKKYPYKKGGKPSRQGLMAAYKRAKQQGDNAVAAKALRLLKKYFDYTPDK